MHPTLIDVPEALVGPRVTLRAYRANDAAQILEALAESRNHLHPWVN